MSPLKTEPETGTQMYDALKESSQRNQQVREWKAGPRKDAIKSSLSLDLNHGDPSINYTAVLTLLGTWG